MKKYILVGLFFVAIFFNVETAKAQRGCCSHHGGVAGCNEYGRTICNDGTLSPSCTCTSIINKEKPLFMVALIKVLKTSIKMPMKTMEVAFIIKKVVQIQIL